MTSPSEFFNANLGHVWVQPDGPNTEPKFLKCHTLDDVAEPYGGITLHRCPDPRGPGRWNVISKTQDPPDLVTTSVTTPVGKTSDWLERQANCPMGVYINMSHCGPYNVFLNYDRGFLLQNAVFSSKGLSNLVAREGSDLSEMSFDLSADPGVVRYHPLGLTRQVTSETMALTDIAFCNDPRCAGPCGPAMDACEVGYIVCTADTDATANVLFTEDSGNTWTATGADPFAVNEDIISVVCFPISRTVTRVLVACGTTAVGAPQVAYSDDEGDAWTLVTVGTDAGEFMQHSGALFALDQFHIWTGTDQGVIHFSSDGGATWTEQTTTNTEGINSIKFLDENYGIVAADNNVVMATTDGGEHWEILVGPSVANNLMAAEIIDENRWWIGAADADDTLWYTDDGGATWAERELVIPGATVVDVCNDIMFLDEYVGFAVLNVDVATDDFGVMVRTFDGGYSWESWRLDTTYDSGTGPNAVWACDVNLAYSVGPPIDATGSIYTVSA